MALVNELLQKSPVVLKIQVEVAIEKKDLIDTTAGQSINETLMNLVQKHIEDLILIKEDIAQAVKEKDARLQKELEATKKKLPDQMKAIEDSYVHFADRLSRKLGTSSVGGVKGVMRG